jgi:hypothetical protein
MSRRVHAVTLGQRSDCSISSSCLSRSANSVARRRNWCATAAREGTAPARQTGHRMGTGQEGRGRDQCLLPAVRRINSNRRAEFVFRVSTHLTLLRVTGSSHDVTDLLKIQAGGSRPVSRCSHAAYHVSPSLCGGGNVSRKREKSARREEPPADSSPPFGLDELNDWPRLEQP